MSITINPVLPDLQYARDHFRTCSLTQQLIKALETDALDWSQYNLMPTPDEPAGWTHHFFCPRSGEPLVFDPDHPHEHRVLNQATILTGENYDRAWRSIVHNTNVVQMERCAILLQLGIHPELCRQQILKFATEYPERYPEYSVGAFFGNPGRLQPQALDEAVWIISFLRGLRWSGLRHEMTPFQCESISVMARMVVDLIKPAAESFGIHNIACWIIAGIAACADWLEDSALLEWCWSGPYGISRQISFGIDADGLWHEGSTHYHYYALSALMSFFEITGCEFVPSAARNKLIDGFTAPLKLAYCDGKIPAYNDSWPNLHVTDHVDLYALAAKLFQSDQLQACLAVINAYPFENKPRVFSRSFNMLFGYTKTTNLDARVNVGTLVFGKTKSAHTELPASAKNQNAITPTSTLLGYSGIAILQSSSVRIGFRYGPYGGWHDHCDKLSIDVETQSGWQSLDIGTSGYGAKITNTWQRSAAAHNTVMIDGIKQNAGSGHLVHYDETRVCAESSNVYDGVRLMRELSLQSGGLRDTFEITATSPRRIDWIFHGDGLFVPELNGMAAQQIDFSAEENGLNVLENIQMIPMPKQLKGQWTCEDLTQRIELTAPEGAEFYWAEAPLNPNGRPMGVIVIRMVSDHALVTAEFFV